MVATSGLFRRVGAAVVLLVGLIFSGSLLAGGPASADTTMSVSVSGNHLVDQAGQTIRLLGVDVPGTEYACEEGWGYSQVTGGDTDPASIQATETATASAIASWHANAVRVPLNEDCWLGINGEPSFNAAAGATGYQQYIENWVKTLNAAGLYVILDLHWTAPGTNVADGQRPMPDDHSAAFWTSVASAFASNHAVVFDAFNEPYSPAFNFASTSTLGVDWSCWRDGGCQVPVAADGQPIDDTNTYTAVGMQTLVDAIRSTGATQPIMLGGLDFSNDLSQWVASEPTDPDGQLVASYHNYFGTSCDSLSCWSTTIASVAASVPVVTGEFDQGFDCQMPPTSPADWVNFDDDYMSWADDNGVSYLAWGWFQPEPDPTVQTCQGLGPAANTTYQLIDDATGAAVAPDGTALQAHLASLAASVPPPPPPTTTPPTTTPPTTTPPTTKPPVTTSPTTKPPVTAPPTTAAPKPVAKPATKPVKAPARKPAPVPLAPMPRSAAGYELVGADGGVFGFGAVSFAGSLPGLGVQVGDIKGIVPTTDDRGYFLVGADGGVFGFGDSSFEGSLPGLGVKVSDIVAIIPTTDDRGYELVGRDGGVFSFGDARFLGSLPGIGDHVDDVVGIAQAAGGNGYWVVESDGVVHGFGTAQAFGNVPASTSPVTAIAATPDGKGYWVVNAAGRVFAFGDAPAFGSVPSAPAAPIISIVPTGAKGYWLIGQNGAVFAFGDAPAHGSLPALGVQVHDVVGAAPVG